MALLRLVRQTHERLAETPVGRAVRKWTTPEEVRSTTERLADLQDPVLYARVLGAEARLMGASLQRAARRWLESSAEMPAVTDLRASSGRVSEAAVLARYFDHTQLKPAATITDYRMLCDEAREHGFYSVCVLPSMVEFCRVWLRGSRIRISAVVGFPLGNTLAAAKADETRRAIAAGADEIDMVLNVGLLKSQLYGLVYSDIRAVVHAAGRVPVKVILETALLTDTEKRLACRLAVLAEAAAVKTCTGFGGGGATVEDIALMRSEVAGEAWTKASGGIGTLDAAERMIAAGAARIGASKSVQILREFAERATRAATAAVGRT